jgi:hypothetical protein
MYMGIIEVSVSVYLTLANRWRALEKLANMLEFLGLTASEMTGAGTNMDVMANCTLPSVKLQAGRQPGRQARAEAR